MNLQSRRGPVTFPPYIPSLALMRPSTREPHAWPDTAHENPDDRRLCLLFRSQLGELLRLHAGEWALIDDSGMVETDVDKTRLLNKHHPANPHYFIIRRIIPLDQ